MPTLWVSEWATKRVAGKLQTLIEILNAATSGKPFHRLISFELFTWNYVVWEKSSFLSFDCSFDYVALRTVSEITVWIENLKFTVNSKTSAYILCDWGSFITSFHPNTARAGLWRSRYSYRRARSSSSAWPCTPTPKASSWLSSTRKSSWWETPREAMTWLFTPGTTRPSVTTSPTRALSWRSWTNRLLWTW